VFGDTVDGLGSRHLLIGVASEESAAREQLFIKRQIGDVVSMHDALE
jgi:hypothetical protein